MKSIILLHGALGAKDQLESLKEALSQINHKVYSFSFSGHGKVPFQNEFGIVQFANELEKFILENKLQQPAIFAYSMGGYVALYLASQKSDLVGNIVTLGTKFNWTKEIAEKEIKQLDPKVIQEKVPKFAEALKQRHGDDWELLLKRTADMMVELGDNNFMTEELLGKVKSKIMIGLAENDTMVSEQETNDAFLCLQNAQRFSLPNAKHPIETVDVVMLVGVIKDFMD